MTKRGLITIFLACSLNIGFFTNAASDSFPKAQNVTWMSLNFKTELTWGPTPSDDYSYTVEFSEVNQDRNRIPLCIRTSETHCDLSSSLSDLKAKYVADVLSEPPAGASSDLVEFPHTRSEIFCPYTETNISKPEFKEPEVGEDKRTITLYVTDPLTARFEGNRQLNIRDIFTTELQYRVTYWRAGSTGKRQHTSQSSEIVLKGLDQGESYCFNMQAYIPTRRPGKQLGELSDTKCSHKHEPSIFDVYSVGVIAGGIFLILAVVAIIVAVAVVCFKRKRARHVEGDKQGVV